MVLCLRARGLRLEFSAQGNAWFKECGFRYSGYLSKVEHFGFGVLTPRLGFMAGISETPVVFEMHRMVGTTIGLSYLPSHGCLVVLGSGKPII